MDFPPLPAVPSSPCPELLSSNSQPINSAETVVILQIIRKAEDEITSLDGGIVQLDNTLRELHARRKELQAFVHAHRGVLSSLRRVPEDVWREVFALAVDSSDKPGHFDPLRRLSGVCRPWRSIVLATPLLWDRIRIGVPSEKIWTRKPNSFRILQRTALQIARSSRVPLTLSIEALEMPADPTGLALLDLLLSRAKQWRVASLKLKEKHLDHIAKSGKSFPALTKLTLAVSFPSNVHRFFAALPGLRDLTLDKAEGWVPLGLNVRHVPWTHLQICELRQRSLGDVVDVLPLLSRHSTLSLVACESAEPEHTLMILSPVRSQVSALSFIRCGNTFMDQLLPILTTPDLTRFSFNSGSYTRYTASGTHMNSSQVLDFLRRSRCSLKHIAFDTHALPLGDEVNVRELFDSEFVRDAIHLDFQLPVQYTVRGDHGVASLLANNDTMLPMLRALTIRVSGLGPVTRSFPQILSMCKTRSSTLRQLWIEQEAELFADEAPLQELRDTGLEVYWRRHLSAGHLAQSEAGGCETGVQD
ncbi:hypothetical protein C8F01DRAFT_1121247 [Mycena amicta]|nr:hypothetical protein C8F01DRAFT_1121247 [Mycena amicta]